MKPSAYFAHTASGRCRIKIPDKRHDTGYFKLLQASITGIRGVTQVTANPVTASVLILFKNQSVTRNDLQSQLQENPYFELCKTPETMTVWQLASRHLESFDDKLKQGTAGHLDFRSALFILFILLAVRQLQKGAVLGTASTLFWSALQLLEKKN